MTLRNKKVLVTGAAGFLGKNLLKRLTSEGADVLGIDNRDFKAPGAKQFKIDVLEPSEKLRQCVARSDVIFPLAAYSSAHMFKEFETGFNSNVKSLLRVLEYASMSPDSKRIVFPSSSTVYAGNSLPWAEESIADTPVNWYAASKMTGELLCKYYSHHRDLETVVLRIFCGYGPGEEEKGAYASPPYLFINDMIHGKPPEIWGDGKQERDLVFVDDIVDALVLGASSRPHGNIFNVGTGVSTSFLDLVNQINEIIGEDFVPKLVPSRMPVYLQKTLADTTKAEKLLGFVARTSISEGIAKTILTMRDLRSKALLATPS